MGKKIILTGATGMTGGETLSLVLDHEEVETVISFVRRSSGITHPKLMEIILEDFTNYESTLQNIKGIDAVLFCIGVYTGAVDREMFHKITVDYPMALARAIKENSPNATFCLLSGSGADRSEKSRMAFAKDKGEAENKLDDLGMGAFYSLRPGYIYPVAPRKEPGFSYKLSRMLYKPLIKRFGKKYSITSTQLAQAMLNVGLRGAPKSILENEDILAQL